MVIHLTTVLALIIVRLLTITEEVSDFGAIVTLYGLICFLLNQLFLLRPRILGYGRGGKLRI